jgi:hypothetical protein
MGASTNIGFVQIYGAAGRAMYDGEDVRVNLLLLAAWAQGLSNAVALGPAPGPASLAPETSLVGSLFHEPWWLSAVTHGQYQEVTVTSGKSVVGRLPFVVKRKLGFTELGMPPFTHVLGPVVGPGNGKPQTQLLKRLSIVRELLDRLPPFDFFKQALSATAADGLAFQERAFQIRPQYTFHIDCRRDPRDLWQDMHYKTRQHIRRAQEKFTIATVAEPETFIRFYETNNKKLGRAVRINFSPFTTMFHECRIRDCGEILTAARPDGTPAGMIYLVWGHGTMYYLLSTRASDPDDNGSVNLLLWEAMTRAHERGLVLDLDGVISSGTARFLSGFGGRAEMRLVAQRSRFLYSALQYGKRRFIGGHADETLAFT